MSHIRPHLNADDRLDRSFGSPALSPLAAAAANPPRVPSGSSAVPAATSAAWRDPLRTIATSLATWRARRRARRELAAVDARTWRDIGVAPEQVDHELNQPFWRPLRNWRD